MNIKELEQVFVEKFDKTKELKQIMKSDEFIIKTRKIFLSDKNYTGISIKIKFPPKTYLRIRENGYKDLYQFYVIRNKKYIGHSFLILTYLDYKCFIKNDRNIDETYLKARRPSCSSIEEVKNYIFKVLKSENHFWWL